MDEKYNLYCEDDTLTSFINPGLDPLHFELDSLSFDARIVISIIAKNILDQNQVVATSVIGLVDDRMKLRTGNYKLFMWLNSKVDETQQYHSYGLSLFLFSN